MCDDLLDLIFTDMGHCYKTSWNQWEIINIKWPWGMIKNEIGGIRNNSIHTPQFEQCHKLIVHHRYEYKHFPKATPTRFVCVSLQISKNVKPYSLFLLFSLVREYCNGRNVGSMLQRMLHWSQIKVAWPLDPQLFWLYDRMNFYSRE